MFTANDKMKFSFLERHGQTWFIWAPFLSVNQIYRLTSQKSCKSWKPDIFMLLWHATAFCLQFAVNVGHAKALYSKKEEDKKK